MKTHSSVRIHPRSKGRTFLLLAVGVLFGVTVAGSAGVVASSTTKSITVCANKKTNVLRYAKNRKCNKSETRIVINQNGVAGAKGDAGLVGPTGAKGDAGLVGPTGVKGDTGATGPGFTAPTATGSNCIGSKCTYQIGETGPGGGIIFFVDYTNLYPGIDYLEAAPRGWGNGITVNQGSITGETTGTSTVDPQMTWCSSHSDLLGLDGWNKSAVGAGVTNTATADQTCSGGAVQAVADYSGGNKTDWFMPSLGESMLMYNNLRQMGAGGFVSDNYWSSSEYDAGKAWAQRTSHGNQNEVDKHLHLFVRPVRSF
jgi:hypothetical protein